MAFFMGRSCSYSAYLRTCLPSAPSMSTSSHSLVSLSRLNSCFFLPFSSFSCRTRRLKLCATSSSSSSSLRIPALLIHSKAEQAGGSSTRSGARLRRLPAVKQASPLETEAPAGDKVLASSVDEQPIVVVASRKRATKRKKAVDELSSQRTSDNVISANQMAETSEEKFPVITRRRATRRKKAVDELPLQQTSDNGVAASQLAETSNKSSSRKDTDTLMIHNSVLGAHTAEEKPLAKSPRRKKQSISADVEDKGELKLEVRKRAIKSKKTAEELPLQQPSDNATAASQVLATVERISARNKTDNPIDSSVMNTTLAAEERPLVKSPRKKKQATSVDAKGKGELSTHKLELRVELTGSEDSASSSTNLLPSGTWEKSPRKKKDLTSPFPVEKIINSATGVTQDKRALKEKSSDVEGRREVNSSMLQARAESRKSDVEGTRELSSSKLETRVELTGSEDLAAFFSNSLPSETPENSFRKKKVFIESATGVPQDKRALKEKSRDVTGKDIDILPKKVFEKKVQQRVQQRPEPSYRKQFAMTNQRETQSQQGYALANVDRARGWERKKRKEFFVRNIVANQSSTISYMQIFGTGFDTGDTVPTVLLFFDRRRFLFNVGEGLHRFCMEHKFKLSKIDHVFLTRVCSETVGGLPGLILTLAEMNETGQTVKTWGPSSLEDLAQAMRVFLPSGWMEHTHSFGPWANDHSLSQSSSSPPILLLEDELIKISAVLLYPKDTANRNDFVSPADQTNGFMLSTVYICELSIVRGKFDPDKARAKGLRPGYKYSKLQKGESVLSDDGKTTVHPEDVLGPSSPGPITFMVDCPSTSYLPSLTSSTSLQSFFSETGKVVNCVIHIGPASVTRSNDYQTWMGNFKDAHHIMAQPEVKILGTPTLASSARTLCKLNFVCPWIFPAVEIDAKKEKEAANACMVAGENLLKYRLRPLADLGLDSSEVPKVFDYAAVQGKWDKLYPEVLKARDMASQVWKRWSEEKSAKSSWKDRGNRNFRSLPACLHEVSREEMELVFLGTGSSQPSKHRNVTGIYIHLYKKGGLMLDCGEGTLAQLKRRYGAKGADDVLLGLKCIWISHLHADHFTGILRILSARRELLQAQSSCEPILVIGPKKLKSFLDSYGKIEDLRMEFLDCSQTTLEVQRWENGENAEGRVGLIHGSSRGPSGRTGMQHIWKQPGYHIQQGTDVAGRKRLRMVLDLLGLRDLYSVPVIHCPDAFAVVLESQKRKISGNATTPGWKLVFSGDTRPCQALVEAAHNATILIHEATFEDDLIAEAVKKNHSITYEAIKVGVDAGAYRIFLTHFSQRYPTIPCFDNRFNDRACMAFDMMSVNLADLPIVSEFLPALQMLFKDQSDADEETGVHALSV